MRWSIEGDNDVVLYAEEGEAIYEVYCQFWKRVLSDALVLDASLPWVSMHICIQDKQLPDDAEGQLDLAFKDEKKGDCPGTPKYFLCCDQFTFLYEENEDEDSFNQRSHKWLLDQYSTIKNALCDQANEQLLSELKKKKQFKITAATSDGLFDL